MNDQETVPSLADFRPDLTRIDRAVEFVRERGLATPAELHAVMGLAPDEYPSSVLASAMRSERLDKDGRDWILGPKERAAATEPKDGLASGVMLDAREVDPPNVPGKSAAVADKPKAQPQPKAASAPPPAAPAPAAPAASIHSEYRWAVWSDGEVEIQCDGVRVATLPGETAKELQHFLARMA